MDWQRELENLKKLMENGKIKLYKDIAPDLRKVMIDNITGKIKEDTISPKLKELLLEIRGRGE